jgi:hypothetical protein
MSESKYWAMLGETTGKPIGNIKDAYGKYGTRDALAGI